MMESTGSASTSARHPHGQVNTDVVDDHILVMTVDRVEKKNAFTPKISNELEDAMTRLEEDPELFVGVLLFAGDHTTAGLEMPLFFSEEAKRESARRVRERSSDPVDPYGLGRRLRKPRITALQGITFTIGIEIALAGDIIVAASDARLCQLEPKRGLAPLGGATVRYVQRAGWGNAMYHLLRADEFSAAEAYRIGLVQEVVEVGTQRDRAVELARELLLCAPLGLEHTIANARLALDIDEPAAIAAIPAMSAAVQATADFQEGIASFIERRPARFTGRRPRIGPTSDATQQPLDEPAVMPTGTRSLAGGRPCEHNCVAPAGAGWRTSVATPPRRAWVGAPGEAASPTHTW